MTSLTPSFYVYFRWSYWWSWNSNIYWFATLQTVSFWVYRPLCNWCNCFIMKLINKRKGAKQARLLSKYIKRRSLEHFWTFLFKFVNGVAVFSPCTPMRKITRFSPLLDPSLNKIVFELWLPLPRKGELFPCKLASELEGVFTIDHQVESQRILAFRGHLMKQGRTDKSLD